MGYIVCVYNTASSFMSLILFSILPVPVYIYR